MLSVVLPVFDWCCRWEEGINAIEEAMSPDEVFKRLHEALEGQLPAIRKVFQLPQ